MTASSPAMKKPHYRDTLGDRIWPLSHHPINGTTLSSCRHRTEGVTNRVNASILSEVTGNLVGRNGNRLPRDRREYLVMTEPNSLPYASPTSTSWMC